MNLDIWQDISVEDYVQDGETVYLRQEVRRKTFDDDKKGELVCTENRLAFVRSKNSIDIGISDVEVVEYQAWTPYRAIIALIGGFLLTAGALFLLPDLSEFPSAIQTFGSISPFLIGVIYSAENVWKRSDTIKVITSGASYKFSGRDLGNVPHAIRGAG